MTGLGIETRLMDVIFAWMSAIRGVILQVSFETKVNGKFDPFNRKQLNFFCFFLNK